MHIISESVLMLLTENYQNWSMLVEATACQSWRVFETQCSADPDIFAAINVCEYEFKITRSFAQEKFAFFEVLTKQQYLEHLY